MLAILFVIEKSLSNCVFRMEYLVFYNCFVTMCLFDPAANLSHEVEQVAPPACYDMPHSKVVTIIEALIS